MSTSTPKTNHRPIPAQVIELEKQLQELTGHVERLQGRCNYLGVVTDALVAMMGETEVQNQIDAMHVERMRPIAELHKANTEKAVEDGKIVASEVIAPSSILVAVERNQRGAITNLRAQIALPLTPELHQLFVGKKAGDTVPVTRQMPDGTEATNTYEILEVYEPTEKGLGKAEEKAPDAPAGEPN